MFLRYEHANQVIRGVLPGFPDAADLDLDALAAWRGRLDFPHVELAAPGTAFVLDGVAPFDQARRNPGDPVGPGFGGVERFPPDAVLVAEAAVAVDACRAGQRRVDDCVLAGFVPADNLQQAGSLLAVLRGGDGARRGRLPGLVDVFT